MEYDPLGLLSPPDRWAAAARGHRHLDRRTRQVGIRVQAHGRPQQPTAIEVNHGRQIQFAPGLSGDLGHVTDPFPVLLGRGEVSFDQVRELRCRLVLLGEPVAAFDAARHQTLAAHRVGHRLLRHFPTQIAQVSDQPRRTMQTPGLVERRGDRHVEIGAAPISVGMHPIGGGSTADPLVEPRHADTQQHTCNRMRHSVFGPLVSDETCHAHFVASFTHRTTDRLRTSRSIRSSAFSLRRRLSSSRSSRVNSPRPSRASRS